MSSSRIRLFIFLLLFSLLPGLLQAGTSSRDLPPHFRTWLNDEVNYIITNEEKATFLALTTDEERNKFIERFWELRNPVPGAPENPYKEEIYRRIAYAKQYLDGVHSAMGQVYITLGEPKQRAKYYGQEEVRPMEIWFYENTNPALPSFFNVLFFDRDNNGTMRLYSPYMDGPAKLATSVLNVNDNRSAFQAIDRALGREVARTTLSLIPGSPVDMQNFSASLESDVMLGIIRNLANHPLTKQELENKRLAESVTHRILLNDEFLDVVTMPLRDSAGNFNLHYLLRLRRPSDFTVEQSDNKVFYSLQFSARVMGPANNLIFSQLRNLSRYLDAAELERIKKSLFGYAGWLALSPGKYKIEFVLSNNLTKTAYKVDREVAIPDPAEKGIRLSQVVAFSNAEAVGGTKDLPFTIGGVKFSPLTGEALTYAPGHNVNLFYQIWAPPADPHALAGKKLAVDYVYGRLGASGDSKTLHEEVDKEQFDAFGSMLTGKKIALAPEAGSGNYRLLVSVTDPDSQQKVYSSLNFRIYTTGSSVPVFDVDDPDLAEDESRGVPEFDRALCSLARNDNESALHWFKVSLAKNPTNEVARSRLAELYFAKQEYAEVAALFSRTPITRETDEQAILRGAESMARTGRVNHAISLLESAITLRKSSGPLYLALANYYRDEGNTEKATQLESKGRELTRR